MARASALINFASVVHEFSMTARMGVPLGRLAQALDDPPGVYEGGTGEGGGCSTLGTNADPVVRRPPLPRPGSGCLGLPLW